MAKLAADKHERFCQEYLIDLSQTNAAIRAGYSAKSAKVHACWLMNRKDIRGRIDELTDKRAKRMQVTTDYVIEGLKKEAETYGEGASHSARVAALAHLGKHLGMFTEKVEHDVSDPLKELLKEINGNTLKPKG